jgi:hypothetical protein
MSSVSNKLCLRNFMIDSKVILHDIFYDISVKFLCAYPTLYTAGMCDVTYIAVYNTYLHGRCFLSALYKDISCLTPVHTRMPLADCRSYSLPKNQHHTSCRITCSVFACATNTRDTAVVILWKANAVNALIPVDWVGTKLDLVCRLKCH